MASNAQETQKQENGSLMMFESYIERRKVSTMKEIEEVYPDVPSKWYATFEMQAKALKNYLGSEKGYLYSRDTGIMPFMEKLASSQMGVTTKDRWNPMDIVMVKRQAEKSIKQKMVSISKQNIENITGNPVKSYSFPGGDLSSRSIKILAEIGYREFFTSVPLFFTRNLKYNGITLNIHGRVEVFSPGFSTIERYYSLSVASRRLLRHILGFSNRYIISRLK